MCQEFVHGCLEADAKLREILSLDTDNQVRKFVSLYCFISIVITYDRFNSAFVFEIVHAHSTIVILTFPETVDDKLLIAYQWYSWSQVIHSEINIFFLFVIQCLQGNGHLSGQNLT
jgi:hypothetical protein